MRISKERKLYQRAISAWDKQLQMQVAIEEMSELTHVLCKALRDRSTVGKEKKIAEEIADVEIMLGQLKEMSPTIRSLSATHKKVKLDRLEKMLEGSE